MRIPSSSALPSFEPAPGPAATKSVFLLTARRLAARGDDRLLRALAAEPLERSGRDDGEARERAVVEARGARTRMPGDRELHAGSGPAVDDLAVPVDLEPVDQRVRDDAADAFDAGELVAGRRADRVERAEPVRERPRGDRTDVPDAERDQDPPEVLGLRGLEVLDAAGWRCSTARTASSPVKTPPSPRCRVALARGACGTGVAISPDSQTRTSIGNRSSSVSSNSPASVASGGGTGTTGWVSAAAETSPSPSMSRAPRQPMCSTRPRTCAGQLRAFGQRRSMSPSFAGASGVPHSGSSSA